MNPLLTLWPSQLTPMLAHKTSVTVVGTDGGNGRYAGLDCRDMAAAGLAEAITGEHRRLIALTDSDPTLHMVAVVPLSDPAVADILDMLRTAVESLTVRASLHIVALRRDLAGAIGAGPSTTDDEAAAIAALDRQAPGARCRLTYSLISDYAAGGASFTFSLNSLAAYLGLLFTALMRDYHAVLPPMLLTGAHGRNIALGLASLRFARGEACGRLLCRAFTDALRKAGIDRTSVDAQSAADRAQRILAGITQRYRAFVERDILPPTAAGDIPGQDMATRAVPLLAAEIDAIEAEIMAVLTDPALTFPEREAVMALIIGRDNPRLRGIRYDGDLRLLDDTCAEPVGIYVDTFNTCCRPSDILPVRGDFAALKQYVTDPDTGRMEDAPANFLAFDPLPDIKRLKLDILSTTELIRRKSDELDALVRAESERRAAQGHPDGSGADIPDTPGLLPEVVEQPLDDTYTPPQSLQRRRSVDLRPFFSPVRNQGRLGACSTFAVVSMYEAIMNRFAPGALPADLSERFVYYYSNVEMRKPEGGSNFHDQLAVMGKYGVCAERLFGYTTADIDTEPPAEAVADAARHRVIKAMQIPLRQSGDKASCLADNHRLLTSALSEGYPVGIALEIYPSFGKNGPFVSRPDEADFSTGKAGYHAMVLAGYSEDDKCYIVRNSWGPDFGDKGYCYISAAYIDDPDLNSFACIIAETTESERGAGAEIPGLVAPFAGTESQIRMAAIRNILDEARVYLDSYRMLYEEYYRYYQRLLQRLSVPQVRRAIRIGAEEYTAGELDRIKADKDSLTDAFASDLAAYRSACRKVALGASAVSAVAIAAAWLAGGTALWVIAAALTALTVILWLNIGWNIRRRRDELNGRIGDLAARADRLSRDLATKQLRFHVAGMWLDRFHELTIRLGSTYDRLVSFNSHLRAWYAEDSAATDSPAARDARTVIYLDSPERLDACYQAAAAGIVSRIDLDSAFAAYAGEGEDARDARRRLRRSTLEAIRPLFADFSMVRLLLGRSYPYLQPVGLDGIVARLLGLAQPSSRDTSAEPVPPLRLILADVPGDVRSEWGAAVDRTFPFRPVSVDTSDPEAIDIITIQPMP